MSGPFQEQAASYQREENCSLSRRLSRHLGVAAGRDDGLLVTRRRWAVLGVTCEEDRLAFAFRFKELIKLFHLNTIQNAFSLFYFFLISSAHYPLSVGRKRKIIPVGLMQNLKFDEGKGLVQCHSG